MSKVSVSIGSNGHLRFRGGTAEQRKNAREAVKGAVARALDNMMAPEMQGFHTQCRGCGSYFSVEADVEDLRGKKTYTAECPNCGRSTRKKIKY